MTKPNKLQIIISVLVLSISWICFPVNTYAQQHSEYQASIHSGTHLHSDGTLPQSIGLEENVAELSQEFASVYFVFTQAWADWGHRNILIGYLNGDNGAGVAKSDDGNIYYIVNIHPGEPVPAETAVPATAATFSPFGTSTPDENGSIFHIVKSGESLWGIAISYGVTIDQIRGFNTFIDDSLVIQPGQKLLIFPIYTPPAVEPSETLTETRQPSDSTLTLVIATPSPPAASIASQTIPVTQENLPSETPLKHNPTFLVALVVIFIGISIILIYGFRR